MVNISLVAVVMPMCGIRGCVERYVSSLLGRACGGLRVVLISSNSGSGDKRVYRGCTGTSSEIGIVRGRGRNLKFTQGAKLAITRNGFIAFVSSSSMTSTSLIRELLGNVASSGYSAYLNNFGHVSRGKAADFIRRCSVTLFAKTRICGRLFTEVLKDTPSGRSTVEVSM